MAFVIISEFLFLAWGKELVLKTNCNLRGKISSFRFNPVKILPMVVIKRRKRKKVLEGVTLLEKESAFFYNQFSFTGTGSLEDPTGS